MAKQNTGRSEKKLKTKKKTKGKRSKNKKGENVEAIVPKKIKQHETVITLSKTTCYVLNKWDLLRRELVGESDPLSSRRTGGRRRSGPRARLGVRWKREQGIVPEEQVRSGSGRLRGRTSKHDNVKQSLEGG